MNLVSSSSNGSSECNNLAKLFDCNFIQSAEDINESNGTSFSDGNSSSQSSTSSSSSSFGQTSNGQNSKNNIEDLMETEEGKGEGQTIVDGLDLSTLALQLLQHAQAQGILFQQQQKEENDDDGNGNDGNEKEQKIPPNGQFEEQSKSPPPINHQLNPSPQSPTPTPTTTRLSKTGNRRSGSKSLISAATAAALMAPSPLGQLPSIPGAIAVAVSPAAQLFNGDDWSWHRNPAAAIRSGGTNKQTPVWKYFVYNKAENLSRCIVGNCTYQLKGPHTSTLACHLKKHSPEYAEFQRLKSEYTRERIAAGHGQAGRLDENAEGSGCSTPTNGSNRIEMVGPCTQVTSPNGTIRAQSPKEAKKGGKMMKSGDINAQSRSISLSCASSPGPTNPIFGQSVDLLQNGGIFGGATNGCVIPPPPTTSIGGFHHFMLAAALAAAQNGHQMANCRQNSLELFGNPLRNGQNGFHHSLGPTMLPENGKAEINLQQGPGSNLLDILNLLTKKAANHPSLLVKAEKEDEKEEKKEKEGEGEEKGQPYQNQQMEVQEEEAENEQRQNAQKEEDEGMQRKKRGGRKRTMASGAEDQPKRRLSGGGGGGLAAHSVEHLLCGTSAVTEKKAILPPPSIKSNEGDSDYRQLALSLGTGLPKAELEQFLASNPFIRVFDDRLTMDNIEQTLQNEFHVLKERMANELHGADAANLVLMGEICCANCWNVPSREDGKCLTKGCESVNQFWCTISTVFRHSSDTNRKRTILLAIRKIEVTTDELAEGLAKLITTLNLSTLLDISHKSNLLIRPQQFSNLTNKMIELNWQTLLANSNDVSYRQIGLAEIFGGRNAAENWAKEEEERLERIALLLCNWHLILGKKQGGAAD